MTKLNADNQTATINGVPHNYSDIKVLDLITSVTTIYPDQPVLEKEPVCINKDADRARDIKEMERAYAEMGFLHPIEQ